MSTLKVSTIAPLGTDATKTITIGDITNGDVAAGAFTNTPAFKATTSSTTTIGNQSYTTITLNSEVFDTDSAFNSNTFTVPSGKGGKYFFSYGLMISDLGDGDFTEIILAVNGTRDETTRYRETTGVAQTTIMRASAILDLNESDTVVLQGYHNYGSNRTSSAAQTSLEGIRIVGA